VFDYLKRHLDFSFELQCYQTHSSYETSATILLFTDYSGNCHLRVDSGWESIAILFLSLKILSFRAIVWVGFGSQGLTRCFVVLRDSVWLMEPLG
jgi:hypothetical protein